jgi:hypothetical protein
MNCEFANNGSWVSMNSIVSRITVVIPRSLGTIPSMGKSFLVLQIMQIGYGAHRAYCSMGIGDK